MRDNKDSTGLILLGILIGIIAFALLSRRTQTLSSQPTIQQPTIQHLDWQPMDIPRVEDIKLQTIPQPVKTINTDPQLVQMASQLEKTASQLEQATSKLQDTISRLQQNNISQPQSQPQQVIIQPIPMYQPPIYQPPQVTVQPLQEHTQQNSQQLSGPSELSNTVYKNNEKWEIVRGSDGRIKSLNIIRDVKKNN